MSATPQADSRAGMPVEARDLTLIYRRGPQEIRALDALSLRIPRGQFVAVMGPSGSGKSSLLHVLAGLQTPTSGSAKVGDVELADLSEREATVFRRRNVGLVFQFFNLIPSLDVERNVALPLRADGMRMSAARPLVTQALEELGLADRHTHLPTELSGGEMQRVAIARALITNPAVLLADEPTGNLDSETGDALLTRLRDLCNRRGTTTILMTHDNHVVSYADRLVRLRDGQVDRDEPVELLRGLASGTDE